MNSDSPDDMFAMRRCAALGRLGEQRAVPILMEWSAAGKPIRSRQAAIGAIAELDKTNNDITQALHFLSQRAVYRHSDLPRFLRSARAAIRTPSRRWKRC